MKQFMLLIRNEKNHQSTWTPEKHKNFLGKCESYISALKTEGKLISAQPLAREGVMVAGSQGDLKEGEYSQTPEIIVGYFHIYAEDVLEAIRIAKANPEFEFGTTARVEVRPIKAIEAETGFVYPT